MVDLEHGENNSHKEDVRISLPAELCTACDVIGFSGEEAGEQVAAAAEVELTSSTKTPKSVKGRSDMEEDVLSSIQHMSDDYKTSWFYILIVAQLINLICIGVAYFNIKSLTKKKKILDFEWWIWGVMIFLVLCGELISRLVFLIMAFFIKRSFFLRKRVVYFVYKLQGALQMCIWMGLVLIVWQFVLLNRITCCEKVLPYVTKIWIGFLMTIFVRSLKTLLVEVLASSFYISKYFQRILDSLSKELLIKKLILARRVNEEEECNPEEDENAGIEGENAGEPNQKNISARNMNLMMNALGTTMLHEFQPLKVLIKNESKAKDAARKISGVLSISCSNEAHATHICRKDLMRILAMGELTRLFDGAVGTKGISKPAFEYWMVNVFRERRALALSLEDIKSVVKKVSVMLDVVMGILILMVWFLIFEASWTHYMIFIVPAFASYRFGDGTFTGLRYLFIMHPYDVGDRCEIEGKQMIVEKMHVTKTVFLGNGIVRTDYPNSQLSTMGITNYRRSTDTLETVDFCIEPSTTEANVNEMKQQITRYVEKNRDHWKPGPEFVETGGVVDSNSNKNKRSLRVLHHMNFQDMSERLKRRALLVDKMMKIFTDLEIEYTMLLMDKISDDNLPTSGSERVPLSWKVCAY